MSFLECVSKEKKEHKFSKEKGLHLVIKDNETGEVICELDAQMFIMGRAETKADFEKSGAGAGALIMGNADTVSTLAALAAVCDAVKRTAERIGETITESIAAPFGGASDELKKERGREFAESFLQEEDSATMRNRMSRMQALRGICLLILRALRYVGPNPHSRPETVPEIS